MYEITELYKDPFQKEEETNWSPCNSCFLEYNFVDILFDEKSNTKVLTNSVKIDQDTSYAFAVSIMPKWITCTITITEKRMY